MAEAAMSQMAAELQQARAQIGQLAASQDQLKAQAMQAIAASEALTNAALAQLHAAGGGGGGPGAIDRIELVDFKVNKPEAFHGKREESWKLWSRQFKTYCNVRKDGFKKALEWAEVYLGPIINDQSIDSMGWASARLADTRLYDFLSLQCKGDALVLVEHYEGLGLGKRKYKNAKIQ